MPAALLRTLCSAASSPAFPSHPNPNPNPNQTTPTPFATLITKPSALNHPPQHPKSQTPNPINDLPLPLPLPVPDLPTHMKEKILSLELMGIDAGRALCMNPALREASLDSIHQVIYYLQSKGIRYKDLPRIFGMCPRVLTSSVKSDLVPVFSFLKSDLGVPESEFHRVIKKCPRLLGSSVRDQLKPALFYLQRLGLKDIEALAFRYPVLLVLSVEKTMIPKLEFLMDLGLAREEAVCMIIRSPDLLTFSIEKNFKPKAEYYLGEMGGKLEELKDFPQYFAFSLEQRIKPRHQELVEKGIKMPLSVMLRSMDHEFRNLVEQSCVAGIAVLC